ncbi:hypothetical protein PCZ31_0337 [Clostridioides difficile]|nr:hypothetical protein PCZ31_0337 [Clostridioides difficile]
MKNIAAFFDIDGTLYRDSLMVEHFKKLIKYDIIDQKIGINMLETLLWIGIKDKVIMMIIY